MLLQDHLLRVGDGPSGQFFEFLRQVGLGGEEGSSVGCTVADVHLERSQFDLAGRQETGETIIIT